MKHSDIIVLLSVDDTLEMALLLGHISSGTMTRLEGIGFNNIREVFNHENKKGMSLQACFSGIGDTTQKQLNRLRLLLHYPFGIWEL